MALPRHTPIVSVPGPITDGALRTAWDAQLLDLYDPEVRYNQFQDSMVSFMEMFMSSKNVEYVTVKNVEKEPALYQCRVGTIASGAAGASVWIPLNADSMHLTGKYMLPQVGYMVQFPPFGKTGVVVATDTTQNAMRIQVRPLDSTYAISVAVGDVLQVVPAAMVNSGDCTIFDNSRNLQGTVYTANLTSIKKHRRINGEELASFTSRMFLYPLTDEKGNPLNVWWHEDLDRLYAEYDMAKYRLKMLGETVTNTGIGGRGMTGFLTALNAGALKHAYPSTGFTSADFDTICAKFIAERHYCRDFAMWNGYTLRTDLDKLIDTMSFGRVNWAAFGGDEQKWVNFGFSGIQKNDFNFYFHLEKHFTDPGYLGAAGWEWTNNAVLLPLAQTVKDGSPTTFYQNLYLASNGYSRELEMRDWGKLKPGTYSGDCDHHTWEVNSTCGGRLYFRHAFMLVQKQP